MDRGTSSTDVGSPRPFGADLGEPDASGPHDPGEIPDSGRDASAVLAADAGRDPGPADGATGGAADGSTDGAAADGAVVAPARGTVTTLAGGPVPGDTDGTGAAAHFANPVNVVLGPVGQLYVADYDNSMIRRVSPAGQVSTVATLPHGINVFGLIFGPGGELYAQGEWDAGGVTYAGSLWRVDPAGGALTLVIDQAGQRRGLALLADGRLVMAGFETHDLRIFDPKSGALGILAGATGQAGFVDGKGGAARFHAPVDLALTAKGTLLVADASNHRLREVALDGTVTTFAGDGLPGAKDGPLLSSRLNTPTGLAIDALGAIYVTDAGGFVVRRIAGGKVTTIAGDGTQGFADGPALQARFYGLEGIDVSADGLQVYIADGNRGEETPPYHRIRLLAR